MAPLRDNSLLQPSSHLSEVLRCMWQRSHQTTPRIGSPPEFIAQVKEVIVPNPVSGPGVINEAVDTDFFTASSAQFPAKTFHTLTNLPLILTNTLCQRNLIYFNETFTDPIFRSGKVTLYSPGGAFPGVYDDVAGYSASGTQIGYNAESCSSAAAKNDPNALA